MKSIDCVVWVILFRDAREDVSTTAVSYLAERAGRDERTVRRSLRRLEKHGIIKRLHRGGPGRGISRWKLIRPAALAVKPTRQSPDK
jgi:predicted transcriptional regulator